MSVTDKILKLVFRDTTKEIGVFEYDGEPAENIDGVYFYEAIEDNGPNWWGGWDSEHHQIHLSYDPEFTTSEKAIEQAKIIAQKYGIVLKQI